MSQSEITRDTTLDELCDVVASLLDAGAATVKARRTRGGTWEIEVTKGAPVLKPALRVK